MIEYRFSFKFSQMKDIKKVLEGRIKEVLRLPNQVEESREDDLEDKQPLETSAEEKEKETSAWPLRRRSRPWPLRRRSPWPWPVVMTTRMWRRRLRRRPLSFKQFAIRSRMMTTRRCLSSLWRRMSRRLETNLRPRQSNMAGVRWLATCRPTLLQRQRAPFQVGGTRFPLTLSGGCCVNFVVILLPKREAELAWRSKALQWPYFSALALTQ